MRPKKEYCIGRFCAVMFGEVAVRFCYLLSNLNFAGKCHPHESCQGFSLSTSSSKAGPRVVDRNAYTHGIEA